MGRVYEHKKAGWKVAFAEVTQGMLEEYFRQYREGRGERVSASEDYGAVVRAAVAAGWISLDTQDVGTLNPAYVRWLADKVNALFIEVTTIPPE